MLADCVMVITNANAFWPPVICPSLFSTIYNFYQWCAMPLLKREEVLAEVVGRVCRNAEHRGSIRKISWKYPENRKPIFMGCDEGVAKEHMACTIKRTIYF